MIYREVFRDAALQVNYFTKQRLSRDDPFSPYRLIGEGALIRTCRHLRDEALPVLNASTSLVIDHQHPNDRSDQLAILPNDFLAKVQIIEVHIDAFVHIHRKRLPALKRVHLTEEVFWGEDLGLTAAAWASHKETERMSWLAENVMINVFSWEWKMKQFALLGDQEGFNVTMTCNHYCISPVIDAGLVRSVSFSVRNRP